MKRQCQNHWFTLESDADLTKALEELMTRVDCDAVATEIVHDDFDGTDKDVCATCKKSIEFQNWLASPEGQAEIERLDPWEDENES